VIDSVVTFKWKPKAGYRSVFTSKNVNITRKNFARFYPEPHRFICVTDDPVGLDSGIEYVPLWDDFSNLTNPSWPSGPSCYRRLLTFGKEFEKIAGKRFICIDLDIVFTGDLRPIVNRTEDFIIWGTGNPKIPYCASMYLMTAGVHERVLTTFDPRVSPGKTRAAGFFGSDQAWINYCLGRNIATWSVTDGVYSYRDHLMKAHRGALPSHGARAVIFHGKPDPWDQAARMVSPWIDEFYREAA